ncbi:MAG: isochorismatase family protein [Clostridia bacterium]|nr:isochorismatase family protein [Clostridia bacterium]
MIDFDKLTVCAADSILLVIDVQERLAPAIAHSESILDKTGILIQAAAALDIPVLATEQYPKGLGPTVESIRTLFSQSANFLGVFEKIQFSALTPEVLAAIQATGRNKVVIAGMETHVCVFQTVRALRAAGFQCFLPQDAVGSRTDANRESGLDLIRTCGAVVTNVETLVFDWLKQAGTPLFKQLSRLIK